MGNYDEFIESKRLRASAAGFEPTAIVGGLFDFQQETVEWACRIGKAAIFADTGLGKTRMQIAWADQVQRHTGGKVLIVAPLCVAQQTVEEAERIGVSIQYSRETTDDPGIAITNYEMLKDFDVPSYSGIVLDESSILKSFMGATKRHIVEVCKSVPYKLACTATPSPNDLLELGNHADFLDVMPSNEMIMRWFQNDTMNAGNYTLKPHAKDSFWEWCATWARAFSSPADIGYDGAKYILPPMKIEFVRIDTQEMENDSGELFRTADMSATGIHKEAKLTTDLRAEKLAELVNSQSDEQWLIWVNTNHDADAIKKLLPDAVEVRGSDSIKHKTDSLLGFAHGDVRVLISKPSIAGMGMNFQSCRNMVFASLDYSYEMFYQAVRRCYRFGQTREVQCYVIATDTQEPILQTINTKKDQHDIMKTEMIAAMARLQQQEAAPNDTPYFGVESGEGWDIHHGDCVHVAQKLDADSIGFSVYSPPFSNLYIYSDSEYDMGNSSDDGQFMDHYSYLAKELYRITKPGRLTAIHCKDLPAYKGRDGYAGLVDFPGEIIRMYEQHGWKFHSRVTIWKDPVIEMQRTKNHGLLYKQLCKDSAASRQGMADYMIIMRKWSDEDQWEGVNNGGAGNERFCDYVGSSMCAPTESDYGRGRTEEERERLYSISVWQRYASPVWFDIQQTNVLNYRQARENSEERHICPLQLDVIERCVELWSNPGDLVFSPFTGIGSEGYVSLKMGRRFVGSELKKSYFDIAVKNMRSVEVEKSQTELF